jgi:hypothetical protein
MNKDTMDHYFSLLYITHLQRMICWTSHLKSTIWMKVVSLLILIH